MHFKPCVDGYKEHAIPEIYDPGTSPRGWKMLVTSLIIDNPRHIHEDLWFGENSTCKELHTKAWKTVHSKTWDRKWVNVEDCSRLIFSKMTPTKPSGDLISQVQRWRSANGTPLGGFMKPGTVKLRELDHARYFITEMSCLVGKSQKSHATEPWSHYRKILDPIPWNPRLVFVEYHDGHMAGYSLHQTQSLWKTWFATGAEIYLTFCTFLFCITMVSVL